MTVNRGGLWVRVTFASGVCWINVGTLIKYKNENFAYIFT